MIEYRVRWEASSHYGFGGATDWEPWEDDGAATADEISQALCASGGGLCDGLEIALEASGFGWTVETREVGR